jgi:RimJ/RimL family protein N-acetyltransferase
VPIRFPITTARLIIRPMRLDDAEALLAVYGDVETMQHLNSELPSTVEEAREWVRTKINLFHQDDQLSLWSVIHAESGQIVGDVGLQYEDYGSGPVVGLGGRGNRGFWRQGLGFEAASATMEADSSSWVYRPSAPKPVRKTCRPKRCWRNLACGRPEPTPRAGRST